MVESEIIAALSGGSPTLVGDRIYAHVLPDGVAMPAVTFGRASTVPMKASIMRTRTSRRG